MSDNKPQPLTQEEFIKRNAYGSLPQKEQEELYCYYLIVEKAANSDSKEILPNSDIMHAAIVLAVIINSAKVFVTFSINDKSHEVLKQPGCVYALDEAQARKVVITRAIAPYSNFIAVNDRGMIRVESDKDTHSGKVYFLNKTPV